MATKNIAAIDVGSNSIKLLVARHDPSDGGHWSEVLREKEMVGGQETLASGSLSEEAIADGVDCLSRYAALARAAGAGAITASRRVPCARPRTGTTSSGACAGKPGSASR